MKFINRQKTQFIAETCALQYVCFEFDKQRDF